MSRWMNNTDNSTIHTSPIDPKRRRIMMTMNDSGISTNTGTTGISVTSRIDESLESLDRHDKRNKNNNDYESHSLLHKKSSTSITRETETVIHKKPSLNLSRRRCYGKQQPQQQPQQHQVWKRSVRSRTNDNVIVLDGDKEEARDVVDFAHTGDDEEEEENDQIQHQKSPQEHEQGDDYFSSSIHRAIPIPTSFVDDLLCRLKKDDSSDDDNNDNDSEDGHGNDNVDMNNNNNDDDNALDGKGTRKDLVRKQLQKCKDALLLKSSHTLSTAPPITANIDVIDCIEPFITNNDTDFRKEKENDPIHDQNHQFVLTNDILISIVDDVFNTCIQKPSKSDDIHGTETDHCQSFFNTCTIQEFYQLVQNQINTIHAMNNKSNISNDIHSNGTNIPVKRSTRTRRTILLKKDMKLLIKERLQYLMRQQQQKRNQHDQPHIDVTEVTDSMASSNNDTNSVHVFSEKEPCTTSAMTTTTHKENVTTTESVALFDKTIERNKIETISIDNKKIDDGYNQSHIHVVRLPENDCKNVVEHTAPVVDPVGTTDVELVDNPASISMTIDKKVTTKGRRQRVVKPKSKKLPSISEECMLIVENVKKRKLNILQTSPTIPMPASDIVRNGTSKRKSICRLCSKCPCQTQQHNESVTNHKSLFCQTDTATEKMLLQRLQKLELITDQYDEQTESVRRLLKKHRRQMYQKRQRLLQQYDNQYDNGDDRNNNTNNDNNLKNQNGSRFLPDIDELRQDSCNCNSTIVGTTNDTEQVKASIFRTSKTSNLSKATAQQPTLTQMIGPSTTTITKKNTTMVDINEPLGELPVVENDEDNQNNLKHMIDPECTNHYVPLNDSNVEAQISKDVIDSTTTPLPKAHRVESLFQRNNDGAQLGTNVLSSPTTHNYNITKTITGSSMWDSFRYGVYDSSWDHWFASTAGNSVDENVAMNHLLHLLPTTPDLNTKNASLPATPQLDLSQRAQTLAGDIIHKVCSNPSQQSAIEYINPNWKENIHYALHQNDSCTIKDALENVRHVQNKLAQFKEQIMNNLNQQQMVLDLYEETLQVSQSRFDWEGGVSSRMKLNVTSDAVRSAPPATQGFFMSQQPFANELKNETNILPIHNNCYLPSIPENSMILPFQSSRNEIESDIATIFYTHDDDDDE